MDASRIVVVFVRRLLSFSLPPFSYLGVDYLFFQRFRWALDSASDAEISHYCNEISRCRPMASH